MPSAQLTVMAGGGNTMGPLRGYSSTMTVFDEIPEYQLVRGRWIYTPWFIMPRVRRPQYRDCRGRFTRAPAPIDLRQILTENSIKDDRKDMDSWFVNLIEKETKHGV